MTYSAITIANFFVQKGLEFNDAMMTPMKVLKLTYIAHGWHLALYDEPLFPELPEAWQYGPVIPSVYNVFKKYGRNRVTEIFCNGEKITDAETITFLEKIWSVYKRYSGWQLSAITHQPDTPWSNARIGFYGGSTPIFNDDIKAHYKKLARMEKNNE